MGPRAKGLTMRLAVVVILVAVAVVVASSILGQYMAASERAQGVPSYSPGLSIAASSFEPAL